MSKSAGSGESDILDFWLNIGGLGQAETTLEKGDHTHIHKHTYTHNLLAILRPCFRAVSDYV